MTKRFFSHILSLQSQRNLILFTFHRSQHQFNEISFFTRVSHDLRIKMQYSKYRFCLYGLTGSTAQKELFTSGHVDKKCKKNSIFFSCCSLSFPYTLFTICAHFGSTYNGNISFKQPTISSSNIIFIFIFSLSFFTRTNPLFYFFSALVIFISNRKQNMKLFSHHFEN